MADYWKSQPRKRCDFCDCWIADNKASIDFHERGKRHKENVEKKIAELRKKGHEQYKQQQQLAGSLQKMEEDALKKFQEDVANDPALSAKYKEIQAKAAASSAATPDTQKGDNNKTQEDDAESSTQTDNEQQHYPVWYEGTSPDGRVYYWNSITQESRWEKPADFDGVSTHSEQHSANSSDRNAKTDNDSKDNQRVEEDEGKEPEAAEGTEDKTEEFADRRAEKRKTSAYGSWKTIEKEELVDLELPENRRTYAEYIPKAAEMEPREKLKFKEKTVTSLSGNSSNDSNVGFKKKRKFGGNVRKRDTTA